MNSIVEYSWILVIFKRSSIFNLFYVKTRVSKCLKTARNTITSTSVKYILISLKYLLRTLQILNMRNKLLNSSLFGLVPHQQGKTSTMLTAKLLVHCAAQVHVNIICRIYPFGSWLNLCF